MVSPKDKVRNFRIQPFINRRAILFVMVSMVPIVLTGASFTLIEMGGKNHYKPNQAELQNLGNSRKSASAISYTQDFYHDAYKIQNIIQFEGDGADLRQLLRTQKVVDNFKLTSNQWSIGPSKGAYYTGIDSRVCRLLNDGEDAYSFDSRQLSSYCFKKGNSLVGAYREHPAQKDASMSLLWRSEWAAGQKRYILELAPNDGQCSKSIYENEQPLEYEFTVSTPSRAYCIPAFADEKAGVEMGVFYSGDTHEEKLVIGGREISVNVRLAND